MLYLKCNNCGNLNEVKTEYLSFCSSCNKKLDNSYSSWKLKNPGKTFSDYSNLVCLTEEDIQKVESTGRKSKKRWKYWVVFFVAFTAMSALGKYGGEMIVKYLNSELTSEKVFDKEWIRETYGDYGLTVETPVRLTKSDLPVPDAVRSLIESMDVYNYVSEKGFKLMINSVKYSVKLGTVNLQGAANGSISEMKNQEGVKDFDYTEEQITENDIPGFIQNGSYKDKGVAVEFVNVGFAKGLVMWQVIVVFQKDDVVGRRAAKRVIRSIEIKEKSRTI
jgi:hypothetical protein